MKVRMKAYISGTRNGQEWPPIGGVIDLPVREAAHMAAAGLAEVVEVPPAPEPRKATAPKPEQRKGKRGRV